MSTKLCSFEREVLAMLAGKGPAIPWGAALGQALEFLMSSGYAEVENGQYGITKRGLEALESKN